MICRENTSGTAATGFSGTPPSDQPAAFPREVAKTDAVQAFVDFLTAQVIKNLEKTGDQQQSSPYLSVAEAADYLRCKPQRVYDLLSARRLTKYKDGSRPLVLRQELDDYLSGRVAPTLLRVTEPASAKALR